MSTLLVADVGNTRIKLGRFETPREANGALLPNPVATCSCSFPSFSEADLAPCEPLEAPRVVLASVNAPAAERLIAFLQELAAARSEVWPIEVLTNDRLAMRIDVDEPSRVGIDRLCAALAADRLRHPEKAAIMVDIGTALKVDLVTADGVFQGGAIAPGIAMSARALHDQTHLLPLLDVSELAEAPDAVGKNTRAAMQAGLFWGAVGAIRELIARQRDRLAIPPQVFLTGGAAPSVAPLLGGPDYNVRYVSHLVLSGIAIAAQKIFPSDDEN